MNSGRGEVGKGVVGTAKTVATGNAWGPSIARSDLFVRNVSSVYAVKGVELVVGLLMLPFNLAHLGQSVYGLWMIAASLPAYFSILDLGFGVAQVKFIAKYRASLDVNGLNEIVSTLFYVFSALGLIAMTAGGILAYRVDALFDLTASEVATVREVLLIISLYVAVGFPFSVFGAVVNGFQRNHLNSYVDMVTTIVVALVNVAVLSAGYGIVSLVAATTAVRLSAFVIYRANAYRAFPGLSVGFRFLKTERLREVTSFSSYIFLIDLANKLNYSTDVPIIGAIIGPPAVAVWAVAQRLISAIQEMTTQVSGALFPVISDMASLEETARLREVFLQGTRLSYGMVVPAATILSLLAPPLVLLWVGPSFSGSIPVIWILAAAVIVRVGNSTATTTLKGAGEHSFLTKANIGIALANLVLSVALGQRVGLNGVALGTLVPLSIGTLFLLFPRACRRVEISQWEAYRYGIWPSVWPIIPSAALLSITSRFLEPSYFNLAFQAATTAGIYGIVFLRLAIGPDDRYWYFAKLKRLAGWRTAAAGQTSNPR